MHIHFKIKSRYMNHAHLDPQTVKSQTVTNLYPSYNSLRNNILFICTTFGIGTRKDMIFE